MTAPVAFIDTSVLCNFVPVPGRDQNRDEVLNDYKARRDGNQKFILPITAVIETGNFIAQIGNGTLRRTAATSFSQLLQLIREQNAPWILHDVAWDEEFIGALLRGGSTGISYVEHAVASVGAGDLCILTERDQYHSRTRIQADIWTLDGGLAAHA